MILLATIPLAHAGSWLWNGGGGNVNWSTTGNWAGGTAPTSNSATALTFSGSTNTGTALAPLNQNIANPFQLNTLTFDNTAGSFFLGGNALTFAGASNTITQLSSNAQSIANGITASTNSTVVLTLAGTGSGIVTLSGAITAGSGNRDYAITKTGTSTFTLSGVNTYGGATTISAGVLNIQNASALGTTASGTTVASGAALQIQNNIAVGTEGLTLNGSGIASDGALRNISGTNSFAGAITLASTSTIGTDSGMLTLSGVISGSGGLTKTGTGTLTLNGAAVNTYTGATTVNQGTLVLATLARSTAGPAITIGGAGSTATVQLGVNFQIYGASTTINAQGQLNLNGFQEYVGTLTLNGGSVVTGAGLLYIGGTGITSTASNVTSTLTGNYSIVTNQIFNIASGTTASGNDVVISGSIAEFNAGTTVTKQGTGKIVLSGANAWKGLTTVSAGVLNIQNASALGTIDAGTTVSSGAALQIEGNIAVGNEALTLNGGGISSDGALRNMSGNNSYAGGITLGSASTVNSDAGTLTLSGGIVNGGFTVTFGGASNITESGVISGTGALTKSDTGTLTLSGINTYSGGTTINGGTVIVSASSGLGAIGGAATINAATLDIAATFSSTRNFTLGNSASTITVDPTFTFTANGVLSGTGALNKTGSGTIALGGVNTYTGATNISVGTLQVNTNNALGTSASGTTVSNGATLTLNGVNYSTAESLTLNGTGVSNGGALHNSGTSTFAGSINAATNATINAGGGTLNLTGGISKNGTTLTITGGGTVNITTNGITGSAANSDLIVDGVTVNENTANSYNGPTYIRNGGILNANVANALPTANGRSAVIFDDSGTGSSQLVLGAPQSVASLTGASSSLVNLNGNVLTIGTSAGTTTFAGVISGTGGVTKDGASTQSLSGANTYSGATTINAGTLTLANSSGNALGSTSSITVNSGGTLALGQSNQINNTATVTLAGGTFAKGDFSEGSAGTPGVGALTLTASGSHLDFGTGTVGVLTFASFTPGSFTLTIDNWTGTAGTQGSGTTDRLIFNSDQSGNLNSFSFTGYGAGAIEFNLTGGFYEVVPAPVPEPSTWVVAALALGTVGFHSFRRRRARGRGPATT